MIKLRAKSGVRNAEAVGLQPHGFRRAVTLFELLLVLVLLVVIGSLAAPLLEGSFASIRLRRGTDQVLTAWSQARTHAIEAGRIYQFQFQSAGGQYRVDPWIGGLETNAEQAATAESVDPIASGTSTAAEMELANWTYSATLPESVVFEEAESVSPDELGQRSVTKLGTETSTEWSTPILFYPDGTTSEASLLMKNDKNQYRRATLRALTGVGRSSELLTRDEIDRMRTP